MSLYTKVKALLPEHKAVISDEETLVLNRRDFQVSQISPVHANLNFLGVRVSYAYRMLLSLIDQFTGNIVQRDFNIVLSDPSLSVAAYYAWMRAGGGGGLGVVYAPKGIARFPDKAGLLGELVQDFCNSVQAKSDSRPDSSRLGLFTIVLGNTKRPSQTIFAADRYLEATQGLLVLKDYGREGACDEREYLESKAIFPAVTLEGHAFALKVSIDRANKK